MTYVVSQIKICFSILIFVCCITPVFALASNYSVSPLVIDHELEKRDIKVETITLTNRDQRIVQIYPTVNEVSVNEGGSVKGFVEPSMTANKGTSVTSWLEISRAGIELQPGETREIQLTIRVNPEVEPGEYHAFIGFPEGSNRPEAEKLVFNGQAPGTVIRIGVDKVQNQFLRLEKFTVERFVKSSTEGEIKYVLQNPGNDPVIPKGEIIFYDNRGNEISSISVNPESTVVEAHKTVAFSAEVPDNMKMGKHKAFLSVEYGETQAASVHDTAFFYVLPVKIILVIFIVVLLLAIAIALFVHKRFDRDEEDEGVAQVAMYIRESKSESKDHDIDLSKKNAN